MKASEHKKRYEQAREIAEYYGFLSLNSVFSNLTSLQGKKIKLEKEGTPGETDRAALLEAYARYNLSELPQPLFIYHSEPLGKQYERTAYGGKEGVLFSLEIIGSGKSISEALLFKTSQVILEESGFENIFLEINSLGDRESITRFSKEFANYCSKHATLIPSSCRAHLKRKDALKALECINGHEKCQNLAELSPKPIGSLSEPCRTHFSEVLEFLESMHIPYNINHCLVGGKDFYTKTIFEIHTETLQAHKAKTKLASSVLARGGCYDDLSKRFGLKKEVPAVGISLSMGGLGLVKPRKENRLPKVPSAYLIQLGFDAKLKSLEAIEILRKAKISVLQALPKDRMASQIGIAEKLSIPYTIIIGQKEALEESAIVRDMKTRSQETVLISKLPEYIRRGRK